MSTHTTQYEAALFDHWQAERRAWARRARTDPRAFCEFVLRDPKRQPIELSGCHIDLVDHLTRNRLALAALPRGTGKSTISVIGLTLYYLGRDPERRIKLACSDHTLATKRVRAIRQYVEKSRELHEVFPDLARGDGSWTDSALTVQRSSLDDNPSVEGRGILSSIVGGRTDILWADDVCDFANTIGAPAKRRSVKQSWFEAWFNQLVPGGRCGYVYTPWHRDDLSADLARMAKEADAAWSAMRLPVREKPGGGYVPVWPEMWDETRLRERRAAIGGPAFARGYLLRAVDDGDCPLLPYIDRAHSTRDPSWLDAEGRASWPRILALDPAVGKGRKRSESAIICVVAGPDGALYIDPRYSFHGQPRAPDLIRMLVRYWRETDARLVLVESNGIQRIIVQMLEEITPGAAGMPVQGWTTGSNKWDLSDGVPGIAAQLEATRWVFPMGAKDHLESCGCSLCELTRQAREWPVGERTDLVMAWWIASRGAQRVIGEIASGVGGWREDPTFSALGEAGDAWGGGFDPFGGFDDDYWR